MRNLILLLITTLLLLVAVTYGINKSYQNKCAYYKTLPNYHSDDQLTTLCESTPATNAVPNP